MLIFQNMDYVKKNNKQTINSGVSNCDKNKGEKTPEHDAGGCPRWTRSASNRNRNLI
jgi:hypothetical protein